MANTYKVIDENHYIEYAKNNFPTYFGITKKEKLKEYRFNIKKANIIRRSTIDQL